MHIRMYRDGEGLMSCGLDEMFMANEARNFDFDEYKDTCDVTNCQI